MPPTTDNQQNRFRKVMKKGYFQPWSLEQETHCPGPGQRVALAIGLHGNSDRLSSWTSVNNQG